MKWYWILLIVLVVLIGLCALYYGVTGGADIIVGLNKSALNSLVKLEFSDLNNSPDNQSKIQSILRLSVSDPIEVKFFRDIETQLNKETTVSAGSDDKYYSKLISAINAKYRGHRKMNLVSALLYFYARTAAICLHNGPQMTKEYFTTEFISFVVKVHYLILLKKLTTVCEGKLSQSLPAIEKLMTLVRTYFRKIADSINTEGPATVPITAWQKTSLDYIKKYI